MRLSIKIEAEALVRTSSARTPENGYKTELLLVVNGKETLDCIDQAMVLLEAQRGILVRKQQEAESGMAVRSRRPGRVQELEEEDED